MKHLIIDGMLNGTGIRDAVNGGYLPLVDLNLTPELVTQIQEWVERYEEEHYNGYNNKSTITKLDHDGIEIAEAIMKLFPNCTVEYYSDAKLEKTRIAIQQSVCSTSLPEPEGTGEKIRNPL